MSEIDVNGTHATEALLGRLFAHRVEVPDSGQPSHLPAGGGVVALVTDNLRVVQLLATGSVRRAVARRLGGGKDSPTNPDQATGDKGVEARVADMAGIREVRWQPAYSAFEGDWLYLRLARQLLGRSYAKQLGFAPAWYASIDLSEPFPRWTVRDKPLLRGTAAGPFATRKRCQQFVSDLEDLFDLCRYHDVLMQTPNGLRCAYFDMGKCPAPCDGTVGWNVYRAQLDASVSFALSEHPAELCDWQRDMEGAAQRLEFEQADRCKQRLARANDLVQRDGRYALSLNDLRVLMVQRGAKRSRLRPFLFRSGVLEACADVAFGDVTVGAGDWLARLRASDKRDDVDAQYRAECTALVCHYLGKRNPASGVYLIVKPESTTEQIAEHIHRRFSRA